MLFCKRGPCEIKIETSITIMPIPTKPEYTSMKLRYKMLYEYFIEYLYKIQHLQSR